MSDVVARPAPVTVNVPKQVQTIGILGGGQLGRMLALAGIPLGLRFRFLDPSPDATARDLGHLTVGGYADPDALAAFVEGCDLVTYEFENVPAAAVAHLQAAGVPVYPPVRALAVAQDRLAEKTRFNALGVSTPPFRTVDSRADLALALADLGLPAVLKTRREGYDGKGQVVLRAGDDGALDAAWHALGARGDLLLEGFVPYDYELALVAARGQDGSIVHYPPIEIVQRDGMLHQAWVPSERVTPEIAAEARLASTRMLEALDYVGVLAIEFFVVGNTLLANEMAPRVHNSGHWSIEGAETSQFAQHIRAICGLPLGATDLTGHVALWNIIGTPPDSADVLALPNTHLHSYGKAARPGRKLGHITVRSASADALAEDVQRLALVMDGAHDGVTTVG